MDARRGHSLAQHIKNKDAKKAGKGAYRHTIDVINRLKA